MMPKRLPHRWLLGCTLLACSAMLPAVEQDLPGPWAVQVGWSGLDVKTRDLIGGNKGLLLGLAWYDERRGLFGEMGLNVTYRSANGDDGRSDIIGAAYEERVPWQQQVYGGLGFGLWYARLADREGGKVINGLAPGAKAFIGYQFPKAVSGVRSALELTVLGTLPVHETSASGITAGLVVGF